MFFIKHLILKPSYFLSYLVNQLVDLGPQLVDAVRALVEGGRDLASEIIFFYSASTSAASYLILTGPDVASWKAEHPLMSTSGSGKPFSRTTPTPEPGPEPPGSPSPEPGGMVVDKITHQ